MDPMTIGLICLVLFFVLMIIGVPVGISMALSGFVGFAWIISVSAAIGKTALIPFTTMIDYNFTVVPAFILMAQILGKAGFGAKLYELCERWLGYRRGGLALATILASAIFAAISSSSIATIVTIGLIAIPEMLRRKYDPGFAGATVASAGGLGILIPPSGILILYALITESSIRKLFIAGIVPGMLLVIAYVITVWLWCRVNPDLAPRGPKYTMKDRLTSIVHTWEVLLLLVVTFGGLFKGWFTPTEAGAVGAAGAILIGVVRRKLTWKGFMESLKDTAANSGMVVLIMIGAFIFNYFVAVTRIPDAIVNGISNMDAAPFLIMLLITFIYIVMGMFMDSLSMMLLTVPFLVPVVTSLGYDLIWFGIYSVMVMEMAMITPPVGISVYATAGLVRETTLGNIFRKVFPFVVAQFAVILVMLIFPRIVTFLPDLLR
jgi:tripartite ATP-independent transporter DctM subunit